MKKLTLLLALTMLVALVSCGQSTPVNSEPENTGATEQSEPTATTEATDPTQEYAPAEAQFVCEFEHGVSVTLGAELPELGEPTNYSEAPSCIHEGMDKVYTYNGFSVTTAPDANGVNRVSEVALLSDSVSLTGGIRIGASKDAVISAFGEAYTEEFGVMRYVTETAQISVVLGGNSEVTSLIVSAAE